MDKVSTTKVVARYEFDGLRNGESDLDFRVLDPATGEFKFVPGRTKQADKEGCDINNILERFERTGELPSMNGNAMYGDFADVPEYLESLNIVRAAESQFMSLPAKLRDRFHNDPAKFLAFVGDNKNYDEAVELGLLAPKPPKVEKDLPKAASAAVTPAGAPESK